MQRLLYNNAEKLRDSGLYLTNTATNGYRWHQFLLARELRGDPGTPTGYAAALRDELGDNGWPTRIIVTSEAFNIGIERSEYRGKLASFFGDLGYDIHVIAYVRPQGAMQNAVYTERVKFLFGEGSFEAFVRKGFNSTRLDYSRFLLPLVNDAAFVSSIRPFNRLTIEEPIEVDFLMGLGIPRTYAMGYRRTPPLNRSPGAKAVALCQAVIERLRKDGVELTDDRRKQLASLISKRTASWNDKPFNGLTPALSATIRDHFAASNDVFAKEIWSRPWSEVFPAPSDAESHTFDVESLSCSGRSEFHALVDEICRMAVLVEA